MRMWHGIIVGLMLVFAPTVWAGPEVLSDAGRAQVVEVIDGDTVILDDGREVRLVGIQAPKLALGRPGFKDWPLAVEAKAVLQEIALGRTVEVRLAPQPQDRHGRVLAHLVLDDGLWLQGEMLARGLARVYTFADNHVLAADMYARERQARSDRMGIWNLHHYDLRNPDNVRFDIGGFQVVEGRVVDAARVGSWTYLNFGADWRNDFTVRIGAGALKLFAAAGTDPLELEGRRIRVRGWVRERNGPMIDATHPEQIERTQP